jgi:16S rRNA (uracil1498-N3)-methyltransferase
MLPYFYFNTLVNTDTLVTLTEETSKHMIQVLRMQTGAQCQLTNGKGLTAIATIVEPHKKHCVVSITELKQAQKPELQNTIAIALLKNTTRFEWFLEKAVELGIVQIVPLITQRTEKQNVKFERMQQIVISAMLQSQQSFLAQLAAPIKYDKFITQEQTQNKLIAHCLPTSKSTVAQVKTNKNILLIGPEGDFTETEIEQALENNYQPITLGNTRLRTETAGIVGATIMQLG